VILKTEILPCFWREFNFFFRNGEGKTRANVRSVRSVRSMETSVK